MRKTRNPKERIPASRSVIGFVRRSDLGNAMAVTTESDFEVRLFCRPNQVCPVPQKRKPISDVCRSGRSCCHKSIFNGGILS
jgi:hypothetical protein